MDSYNICPTAHKCYWSTSHTPAVYNVQFLKVRQEFDDKFSLRLCGNDQPQTPKLSFFKIFRCFFSFPAADHSFLQLNWPCMGFFALLVSDCKSGQHNYSSKARKKK